MTRTKKWYLSGGIALLLLSLGGWASLRSSGAELLYTAEAAKRQDLRDTVAANGEIQAKTRVSVGTTVTAEIKEIHVKDGQWVKAGDLLVTLDRERFKQDLNRADLSLRQTRQALGNAQATVDKLQKTFERQESLFHQGLISSEDFQQAKLNRDGAANALEQAKVSVQQAQSQVALSQDALNKTELRAPMAGRVTGLKVEKGEMAVAGQTNIASAVLMVVSDLSDMLAEIKVGELDVVKLKPGQPAEIQVDAVPNKVFQGRVLTVATSSDKGQPGQNMGNQDLQNYKVQVQLEGSKEELAMLRPGMSARVAALVGQFTQVLTVPLQAIQEREEKSGLGLIPRNRQVLFVVKDGKAEERALKAGAITRRAVEVLAGVKEGEQVLTGPAKGLATLHTGDKVKLAPEGKK